MERSATPTALVERDKLDPSSLAPPKWEMESSFSWTYLFKSPTSSTLCFGQPTLRKLNQVKLLCNPTSSTLCDFTLGKLNQETGFYITNHTPLVHTGTPFSMAKSSPETNRVSDCQSSLVATPSSRLILDKHKIEVNKARIHHIGKIGEHFYGENFIYDFPKSWKHIKEVDWETNSSSTTLHLDTCSWKVTGEANPTTPCMDVLWLTGKVMQHITLTI